jgi:hypothetical protein
MAKPQDRYKGKLRPFVLLAPEEDKIVGHAAIDADLNKSEYIRKAALYCAANKIDLSKIK